MNLISEPDASLGRKLGYFALVFIPVMLLTLYTIARSKRLSDFLDAVSDDRLDSRAKFDVLLDVWRNR
jgi:hypothetical protein